MLGERRRVRDILSEGCSIAHHGGNYGRALNLLRSGLSASATKKMLLRKSNVELIADAYDSLGHVVRALGYNTQLAASLHLRGGSLMARCGLSHSAAQASLSAAHCLQREY